MSDEEFMIRIVARDPGPTLEEWCESWSEAEINEITNVGSAVERVLRLFTEQETNWNVLFKQFKVDTYRGAGAVATWQNSRMPQRFWHFLTHADVKEKVPAPDRVSEEEVRSPQGNHERFGFQQISHLHFLADVAGAISSAGAYSYAPVETEAAIPIALGFCKELLGKHELGDWNVTFYRLGHRWSSWFYGVAWDHAWVIEDNTNETVTLFFATDTD
ncbi:hypothetical protein [Kordiimonas aestuarii]|uniref:hypothetical protein n=1 Tax=Kordiimonas aestuarii TaxID=1005925 RepID=UPI0021D206B4|nr:hypothetical protein [Kordiimonas aestuarii]